MCCHGLGVSSAFGGTVLELAEQPKVYWPTMRLQAFSAIGLLLILAAQPGKSAARQAARQSPDMVAQELQAICQRLRDGDNPYYGRGMIPALREQVQRRSTNPAAGAARMGRLAFELLRLGEADEAIELLGEALETLDSGAPDAPTELQDSLTESLIETLALAHFQIAETTNCLQGHDGASCTLPLRAAGVHRSKAPIRRAGELLRGLLERHPDDISWRWLLNLASMLGGDFPEGVPPPLRVSGELAPAVGRTAAWRNIADRLGVASIDLSGGAIIDDFDGDGLLDLVTSTSDPCDSLKAFRHLGDDGFEDVTESWGLSEQLGGLNLIHADYDNDGMLDLLVLRGGWWGDDGRIRNSLLRNDLRRPAGRFVDQTVAAGVAYPAYPTQTAAWADFDLDGDLDLYIGNESSGRELQSSADFLERLGRAFPAQLFRNEGDGRFRDVAARAGVTNQRFAKGVAWGDYDNDGDPDLYVSNIGPNRLYRNDGDGSFTDVAPELGVTEPSGRSFPVWFFDYDNNGWLDLLVTDYSASVDTVLASYLGPSEPQGQPRLYRNQGGRFTEVSVPSGLVRPLLPMGAGYGDLDNDGWLDLFFGTGVPDFESLMPNAVYRNLEGGGFEEVTFELGLGNLQKGAWRRLCRSRQWTAIRTCSSSSVAAYPYDRFPNALFLNPGNHKPLAEPRAQGYTGKSLRHRSTHHTAHRRARRQPHHPSARRQRRLVRRLQPAPGRSASGPATRVDELLLEWPGGNEAPDLSRHRDQQVLPSDSG